MRFAQSRPSFFARHQYQTSRLGFYWVASRGPIWGIVLAVAFCCVLAAPARAQQPPEDPEDDKQLGLWLDQGISSGLTPSKSLEIEFHERYDEVISNFYEYFVQSGIAFRVRPWLTVTPSYRYQRFPGNPGVAYENRLLLNATLPLRMKRRPVLVVSNEFFIVPGTNSFAAGGSFTQNRFQVGVRLPMTDSFSIRPYYLLQSVNLPNGWETNEIVGISMSIKVFSKSK